jgi:hypothetical protein
MSQINSNKENDGIKGLVKGLFSDPIFRIASNNISQAVNNLFAPSPKQKAIDSIKDNTVDENAVQLNIFNDKDISD